MAGSVKEQERDSCLSKPLAAENFLPSAPSLCKPAVHMFIAVLPLALSVCVFASSCFPASGTKGVQEAIVVCIGGQDGSKR